MWPGIFGAIRHYSRRTCANVAIESVASVATLVLSLAVLIEITNAALAQDRFARAARAAAYTLALDSTADVCAAIRRELGLEDAFDCSALRVVVDRGVSPDSLPATLDADVGAETGDLVLVRIHWSREPIAMGKLLEVAAAADSEEPNAESATTRRTAFGLARCENAGCT